MKKPSPKKSADTAAAKNDRQAKTRKSGRGKTARGDVSPDSTSRGIETFSISESTSAARESKTAAISDILHTAATTGIKNLSKTLEAILDGASPDDVIAIGNLLSKHVTAAKGIRRDRSDFQLAEDWREGGYPYENLMSRRNYEREKYRLQVELLKLQAWVRASGQRVVILFEGRDAAGKGGAIKRFMEHLNPRGARVVALEKPTEEERGQWYFQRYVEHLPTRGEIVMFDRS